MKNNPPKLFKRSILIIHIKMIFNSTAINNYTIIKLLLKNATESSTKNASFRQLLTMFLNKLKLKTYRLLNKRWLFVLWTKLQMYLKIFTFRKRPNKGCHNYEWYHYLRKLHYHLFIICNYPYYFYYVTKKC